MQFVKRSRQSTTVVEQRTRKQVAHRKIETTENVSVQRESEQLLLFVRRMQIRLLERIV